MEVINSAKSVKNWCIYGKFGLRVIPQITQKTQIIIHEEKPSILAWHRDDQWHIPKISRHPIVIG